jgi:NADH dehydrogenase FAD-containing subunit
VESAGALSELYRTNLAADYPSLQQDLARIVLVEADPALLPTFEHDVRAYAKRTLEDRRAVHPTGVATTGR